MSQVRNASKAGKPGRVRVIRAQVVWLDGACGVATLTVDDTAPAVLMVDGDPFVRFDLCGEFVRPGDEPRYHQVKPYRVDAGLLEGVRDGMSRDQVIEAFQLLIPRNGEIIASVGGTPMRLWRTEDGKACAEDYVPPLFEQFMSKRKPT